MRLEHGLSPPHAPGPGRCPDCRGPRKRGGRGGGVAHHPVRGGRERRGWGGGAGAGVGAPDQRRPPPSRTVGGRGGRGRRRAGPAAPAAGAGGRRPRGARASARRTSGTRPLFLSPGADVMTPHPIQTNKVLVSYFGDGGVQMGEASQRQIHAPLVFFTTVFVTGLWRG
jgi:hypothetical protein